jgi:hypothetical protein
MLTLASGDVIKDSFLQEKKISKKDIDRIPRVFIDIKNNAKRAKEKKRLIMLNISGKQKREYC